MHTRASRILVGVPLALTLALGCGGTESTGPAEPAENPFLAPTTGKADTGYLNNAGYEVEVTLEADVKASSYQIHKAPLYLAQYAVTYLRKRKEFYMMLLNEDVDARQTVEWLVEGSWITSEEAQSVPAEQLTHFRVKGIDVVVLNYLANQVEEGDVFTATVPLSPYSVMEDAADSCASYNSHITLGQSVYWYLWNPKSGCQAELQEMQITVAKKLPQNPVSYPEYDKLWEDNVLSVVVVFGKLDDEGPIEEDWNWSAADRFGTWLEQAGFEEAAEQPELGRRFTQTIDGKTKIVDLFYPDLFHSVADWSRLPNWQQAVNEHEVILYSGHSVLGTGTAYKEITYPAFYQIHFIGGCLGYEYYVEPVLKGKGSWASVDAVSSIVENGYGELNPSMGSLLAGLFWGFDHGGKKSWQEIMADINTRLGHSHFGVSGARGNCFSPDGSLCEEPPAPPTP